MEIREATGTSLSRRDFRRETQIDIRRYGAAPENGGRANQAAINAAIEEAAKVHGTVVVPAGHYETYTLRLRSHVTLYLADGAVLLAGPDGEGYDAPEENRFAPLQDHGHSYFANSLITGFDLTDIAIEGPGVIDGAPGLKRWDPAEVPEGADGAAGMAHWWGNKAIALVRCRRVLLADFTVLSGGHFAVIASGCEEVLAEGLLLDTNRDGFDIDACRNVTVRRCRANTPNDDGLCVKASMGAGLLQAAENILIEDCTVSGYDVGTVYDQSFGTTRRTSPDRGGPTGRVKFGTESTGGLLRLTVRRVHFERSRGFAVESVDGGAVREVILEDCTMQDVSDTPIFLRIGDRGRHPSVPEGSGYTTDRRVPVITRSRSVRLPDGGTAYLPEGDTAQMTEMRTKAPLATMEGIRISGVRACGVDGRTPILIAGLKDSPIRDVEIRDVTVEKKSGLPMACAVWQRDIHARYTFRERGDVQDCDLREHGDVQGCGLRGHSDAQRSVRRYGLAPLLVNSFFCKDEARLPRLRRLPDGTFAPAPLRVPEMAESYPEPGIFGILPAGGLYARHVRGLKAENVTVTFQKEDGRYGIVLDDAEDVRLEDVTVHPNGESVTAADEETGDAIAGMTDEDLEAYRHFILDPANACAGVVLPEDVSWAEEVAATEKPGTKPALPADAGDETQSGRDVLQRGGC